MAYSLDAFAFNPNFMKYESLTNADPLQSPIFEVLIVAFERPLFPNFDKLTPYIRYGIYFGVLLVTNGITSAVFGVIYLCDRKLKFCGKKSPHDDDEESHDHEESSNEEQVAETTDSE
ncbi:hypothetical protein EWB00_008601 [Schistosoma japonicum]|uniref:Uncharacterized protein n=1 Tax=Schistosoma japonicum TaxID=6182 RepID=A0A4Z2CPE8_SCHJA|nr:hypothetical protein EWB00_008601 [Schistosoma japonicum]